MPNIDLAGIACPDRATLVRLLRGLLAEDETSRLEGHLHGCPTCCQAVRTLDVSDALLDAMRGADSVRGLPNDETVRGLIDRLKALRLPMRSPADGDTLRLVGDFTDTDAWGVQELLDPPESEGELGRLAGYRVLRVLGAGGMGVVLAAEDPRLLRRVAIKVMDGRLAAHEDYRQRFLREARAAAAIEHPHIVAVHQVGEHCGFPFLAMQLLEGESLDERILREGRLPLAESLRIGRETAEALAAAHRQGLIHRDVKPANIWLQAPGGVVKLLDFGLAHFVENEARMTQTGLVLGTPSYMSPEQARGELAGSPADLFSLGAVLYRMTTGQEPFGGANTLAVLTALAISPPTPPRELNAALPPAFSDLIVRLLAKRPDDRPASAEAVADQLRAIAAGGADPQAQPTS
ncbi:MAG TPA: serine/threonine-protein kinase, partial [Pirellulales bacterium]|nr:serine/threonine-protein kinase [Pirellulales bacterium]